MKASEVLEGLSSLEKRLLLTLEDLSGKGTVDEIFEASDFGQTVEVMNAASWLQSKGLVDLRESARKRYSIKRPSLAEEPLPERTALQKLEEMGGSAPLEDLQAAMDKRMASIAIGWLKRKGLADIHKGDDGKVIYLTSAGERALEKTMDDEALLQRLAQNDLYEDQVDLEVMQKLLSRQDFVDEKLAVTRTIELTDLGKDILQMGVELTEEVAQLTPDLIQSGRWREVSFRKYDIRTFAPSRFPGKKHPLSRIADEVRRIFIQMGFTEIDEEYVQPAFWNMDTLFIPQDHPARELQDTFYLTRPSELDLEEQEIVDIIKSVHEDGWETGSTGWGYEWDVEMAKKALLRTHTTVNTIKHLWRNPEPPVKVFSLSRVFRNEAIDSTHLPEFLQIEGIIMEEDANLDILVAVLKDFYRMMGFEDVRVRPGYFPYTEPSLEVEVYFNGAWMELGGSGIFRPEVTRPFGVEHPVLAWGLGFERLAMLRWNLKDIRELYISDLDMLRESPLF